MSCGNRAGMGRAARSSDAADTVLRVKRRGRGEALHLGIVAWAGEGRRAQPASSTGRPRRGQLTSGIGLRWSEQLSSLRHSLSPIDTDQWVHWWNVYGPSLRDTWARVYNVLKRFSIESVAQILFHRATCIHPSRL
jgi:hypothetical protein